MKDYVIIIECKSRQFFFHYNNIIINWFEFIHCKVLVMIDSLDKDRFRLDADILSLHFIVQAYFLIYFIHVQLNNVGACKAF